MSATIEQITASQRGSLPGELGFEWTEIGPGRVVGQVEIAPKHFSPHGLLHGGTIVALADSACGFGCLASLPQGAQGFATAELKANFIGTARGGLVRCAARLIHSGRATQVWDAEVRSVAVDRTLALFRCTQMLFYPNRTAGTPACPPQSDGGQP
jgi:1,4-dihydroxy-2-naphthoyl-CoA hydrolase